MRASSKISIPWLLLLVLSSNQASADSPEDSNSFIPSREEITVKGRRIHGKSRSQTDTKQTEVLDSERLKRYGAHSLADAVSQASGINTQTFCANCGAKRISIDGLRGEHTTILIDDFPLHSTVSAFYGVDAIPVAGISSVEVNRGAGNALLYPESIGGAINLRTLDPIENKAEIYTEKGSEGSSLSSVMASLKGEDTGLVVTGQRSSFDSWDIDGNGIGESPYRANEALSLKIKHKFSEATQASFRHSESDLTIIGGNTRKWKPGSYTRIQAQPSDFVDNDVTKKFVGDESRITDVIQLFRKESALALEHDLGQDLYAHLKLSRVGQELASEYSHGYDYRNQDVIDFASIAFEKILGDHTLTLLVEQKKQRMDSESDALYVNRQRPLTPDSLRHEALSLGLMDQWDVSEKLSLDLAVRIDEVDVHWTDLNQRVRETLASPKLNAKYLHTDRLTSQLSLGQGFRPPLTLFESEHGSDHDGFLVKIDQFERSDSAVYSLSANYPTWFVTGSAHWTKLKNMAYAQDRVVKGQPLVFENSNEDFNIGAFDIFTGMEIAGSFRLQLSFEQFVYEDAYTKKLPSAAIEQRAVIDGDFEVSDFDVGLQLAWIGARDLARYGYEEHFKKYDLDVASPTFGEVSEQKNLKAPSFWHANFHSKWSMTKNYALAFRINNVFDFTQTGYGDSPTTWHYHVNHAHFDNFHTWGPLTGREYFFGLQGTW